jgi:alpha-D-xyloside xylohydrolase
MRNILFLLTILFLASCASKNPGTFSKESDGITVYLKKSAQESPQQVRLQVISDKIIHVTATAADTFSTDKSLIVADAEREAVKWDVAEGEGKVTLKTALVQAEVNLSNGAVSFRDSSGNVIVKEKNEGSKFLYPVTIKGHKLYKAWQVFEAAEDEAFYGLGQHQDGILNRKGSDLTLLQYNTNVAIPYVVSNKNYGILWDNYSLTKIGDTADYKPISMLKLYDAAGAKGGLTTKYISKKNPTKPVVRTESKIDYEFIPNLASRPDSFDLGTGTVIWEGSLEADSSGDYRFWAYHAGYCKIWMDGNLIVDKWRQCWNAGQSVFTLTMQSGKKYPVKVEWIPDGGESYMALKCLPPKKKAEINSLSICSQAAAQIDYYFVYGQNMDELIAGYRNITGKANIMPKWAMGFWQSRERYKTQEEILNTVQTFRSKNIPIDNIVLDWFYWEADKWGSQQFDKTRFPNAEQMIKDLHEKYNTNLMISVWPKFYEGIDNYKIMNDKNWLYKMNVDIKRKDWIGYVSTFYDAFNPEAREVFWDMVNKNLFSKGIDAWWLDASEPDVCSNVSVQERQDLMEPLYKGPAAKYFNAFPLQNAKGIYEGQRKVKDNQRVFILTRSAFAGLQRYSGATWSGDISARWHDMKDQIPAGISFSMSGLPYWTMDIGGFSVEKRYENAKGADLDEWREQYTRWYQFGAFCPLFRSHGQFPLREIFNIAPENHPAYQSILYYDKLRYHLMPYIYTLAGNAYFDDATMMRGLVMDFPKDAKAINIADQYMFGPSFLVNPVYEYKATKRKVYLPEGQNWYDFYTGKSYTGGQEIMADAPYGRMPLFVKEGSIVPFGPEIQFTTQKPADPLTVVVYTGKNGKFVLYEDENVNYNYEKGNYSQIPFSYDETSKTLTIGERKGSFDGMLKTRTIRVVWANASKAVGHNFDLKADAEVKYEGKALTVNFK